MLYLIDVIDNLDNTLNCSIFNDETKKTNILTVQYKNPNKIHAKCDCECNDNTNYLFFMFNIKNSDCIHKKIINTYYFDDIKTKNWTIHHIDFLKSLFTIQNTEKGNNIECIICLDDINYCNQNIYSCNTCKNAFHSICWHRYVITNWKTDCSKCCICKTGEIPYCSLI